MRFNTFVGIFLGFSAILFAFYIEGGDMSKLILPAPLIIVIGGTLMAGMASTSWKVFKKLFVLVWLSFFPRKYDRKFIALQLLEFSLHSRKDGMLVLEKRLRDSRHPYIRRWLQVGLDGVSLETFDNIFQLELDGLDFRHSENIALFHKLGGLSPTMGIIGTVMGLIQTMSSAGGSGDADQLVLSISVAFLATL